MTDPLRYFRIEARELAEQMGQAVLELDRGPDRDVVARLLRLAHTLKGAARVVRQPELADRAHALEDILVPYREEGGPPADEMMRLLSLSDAISAGVESLDPAPGPAASGRPTGTPPAETRTANSTVHAAPAPTPRTTDESAAAPVGRSATSDVDELLDAIGEAHVRFAPLHGQAGSVQRLRRAADSLVDQLRVTVGRDGDGAPSDAVRVAAAALAGDLAVLGRRVTDTVEQVERELDEVRGRAERLRLVAASTIFTVLHRAVHDAAQTQRKRVRFTGRGGDLRIDPQMLAQASSALLHVVRNAVAHGIEPAADRARMGKPADGTVTVEVIRRGRYAVFRCGDDGRGFDLDAVRRTAVRRGLLAPEALPGTDELLGLLLRGGISTSESVTEVSGRGIGLDVVRDMAEQVGGTVRVETSAGAGSTVELSVPLALLSLHGLVVSAAGTVATLPLDAVQTCVRLDVQRSAAAGATGRLPHEGEALPYVALARALNAAPTAGPQIAVIVAADARRVAIGIDELLGTSTLVVRPLPELAPASAVIGGVSLDVEGNPRAVLDPAGLVETSGALIAGAAPVVRDERAPSRPILVVDDSLTTRMLERSILESAGYDVDLAASAEEALVKARLRRYALFLADIDMPGLNGFEFVEHTRADPELASVPAILVSSRASAEDRQRGHDAGASAYVVKGEFDQEELLTHIRNLVSA